ncbi:hypothetical protein [Desulforhopalus singaporensis]|uniref:Peptidoglycan-synthase activator LpoB n=1 Tax=Desulforhopalus singaporensis TaxID=91360 RepID=A0A1H0SE12_9BACT|nr:hypothetical protein [Desulforhopalus singaporensis]SDP40041.1 Peptidoglycan-synthase activator LpoB [Desulforhopalus singaporensis]
MNRLKYLIIGALALVLAGCGQTVIETLQVPGGQDYDAPGSGKSIVILPFADYSEGNIESAQRRDRAITEHFTDRLVANGFWLPIQEDVCDFLVAEEVIQPVSAGSVNTSSIDLELENEWSAAMKSQLNFYKDQVQQAALKKSSAFPGTHGLDRNEIVKIGRQFNADYVVRGRILEYKTRDEANWAPWKKGILPFAIGGTNRAVNGFASSDAYDERNEMITGALLGTIIGYNNTDFPSSDNESIFGFVNGSSNAVFWGAVGGGLGTNAHNSGKVDQAVVQMRVWVQEAATGAVVWTNRVRVQVSPETVYADNQYDHLFDQAIEKGVTTLVDHFVTYGL